jgi:hypothetical protein
VRWLVGQPGWELEIHQKVKGVDFYATFPVSVYDLD